MINLNVSTNDKIKRLFYLYSNANAETFQREIPIKKDQGSKLNNSNNSAVINVVDKLITAKNSNINKIISIIPPKDNKDTTKGIKSSSDNNSTSILDENIAHKEEIETDFSTRITSMLRNEDFECGIQNQSEYYFRKCLMKNKDETLYKTLSAFINNFHSNNSHIIVGFLHIVSHLEYKQVLPTGQSIAIMALNYNDSEVQEYAIKCFENWGEIDGIKMLEAVKFTDKWLGDYAKNVIEDLKTR